MRKKNLIYSVIGGVFLIVVIYSSFRGVLSKSYHQQIAVKFSPSNCPIIEVAIEGNLYPIVVDLGSKFQFTLNQDVLATIHKQEMGTVQWKDIRGSSYEAPSHILPKINIGDLVLTNIVTREDPKDFISNVILWDDTPNRKEVLNKKVGTLGRPLLEKFNLLLDFQNSRIIVSNDLKKLGQAGFDIESMAKVPMENGRGIIFNVNTDLGIKKFDLDTGATINVVRASLLENKECKRGPHGLDTFTTSKFIVDKTDFGKVTLHLLDVTPELHELDGCIGMRFLKDHVVYIDYQHKILYIGKPNEENFTGIGSSV
jgi:hypothetical protein